MKVSVALSAIMILCVTIPVAAAPQTGYTILHSFAGWTDNDGAKPRGTLVSDGSMIYGTTSYGGSADYGTIFSIAPYGSGYTIIHHFGLQTDSGAAPTGSLVSDGSVLYGTTSYYGPNYYGTVFAINTDGTGYTDLHGFSTYPGDGRNPYGGLVGDGTMLYGTTVWGGTIGGGTVFSLEPNVSSASVLHSFPAFLGDGALPYATVTLDSGTLYGTTTLTLPLPLSGTLYSLETDGSSYTILHQFGVQTDDGALPISGILSDGSRLYGTTAYGGTNYDGTVFSLNPDGSDYTIIHNFPDFAEDGLAPGATLVSDGTRLYGTTIFGGGGGGGYYGGTLFAMEKDGSGYTILHDFSVQTGDGTFLLLNGLLLADNTLYGMTSCGGVYDYGVIFSYTLPSPTPTPAPTPEYMVLSSGDYNGNGNSDLAVFRPSSGLWAVRNLGRVYFGAAGDIPVSGDYDGDGFADVGIFRPSTGLWAIKEVSRVYFGSSSDLPVPGDYDGNGSCDFAVCNKTTGLWSVRGVTAAYFGTAGDFPVPADYNGDGLDNIGIFRPSTGLWAVRGVTRAYFGTAGDTPVPADYVWYGAQIQWAADIAVFRPSTGLWAVRGGDRVYFGRPGDIPFAGRFTGGAQETGGIFRPEAGLWSVRGVTRVYFGVAGDMPVTR
ncbi:MAG: choice-of-anchor tandem repeat GloVer-containing protein [PVC group bacterium]